jgi:phage terminase large subunit-like protein
MAARWRATTVVVEDASSGAAQAPWVAEYERELLGFPSEKYDDQVDSTTIFLEYVQEKAAYEPVMCPCIVGYYRPAWLVGL